MSDEELVKRLRASRAVWENGRSHPTDDEAEAADRIDELEVSLQAVLDREAATTARYEAKLEALTEQLEAARADYKCESDQHDATTQRLLATEAKLAQAAWLLTEAAVQLEEGKIKTRRNRAAIIWNLLDEMKADNAP